MLTEIIRSKKSPLFYTLLEIEIEMIDILEKQRFHETLWNKILRSPNFSDKLKKDNKFQDFYITISQDYAFDMEKEFKSNLFSCFDLRNQNQNSERFINFYIKKMGSKFVIDYYNFLSAEKDQQMVNYFRLGIYYFIVKPWVSNSIWARIFFDRFILNPASNPNDKEIEVEPSRQEFIRESLEFDELHYPTLKNAFENAITSLWENFYSFVQDNRYFPPNWDNFTKILVIFFKNYMENFIYYLEDINPGKLITDTETFSRFRYLLNNLLSNPSLIEYKLLFMQYAIPDFCEKIKKFYLRIVKKKIFTMYSPKCRNSNISNNSDKNSMINLKSLSEMLSTIEPVFSDYISIDQSNDKFYPRSFIVQQFPTDKRTFERYGIHSVKNSMGFMNLSLTLGIFPKYENDINLTFFLWRILSNIPREYSYYSANYVRTFQDQKTIPEEIINLMKLPYGTFIDNLINGQDKKDGFHYIQTYFKNNVTVYQDILDRVQNTKNKRFLTEILATFTPNFHERLIKLYKNHRRAKKNQKMIKILAYLKKELKL